MIKIINKAYLIIIFFALWGLYEKYEESKILKQGSITNLESVRQAIAKAKKDKKKIDDYLKNIDLKKGEIEEVALQIEKLQKRLPQKATDSENVSLIRKAADKLKIRDVEVNPGAEKENGFYISKAYDVRGVGTYLQFLMFLENLAASERILNLRNLTIERSDTKIKGRYDVLKMVAEIESYRYNEYFKEDRGIEALERDYKQGKLSPTEEKPTKVPKKPRRKGAKKGASE